MVCPPPPLFGSSPPDPGLRGHEPRVGGQRLAAQPRPAAVPQLLHGVPGGRPHAGPPDQEGAEGPAQDGGQLPQVREEEEEEEEEASACPLSPHRVRRRWRCLLVSVALCLKRGGVKRRVVRGPVGETPSLFRRLRSSELKEVAACGVMMEECAGESEG